MGLLKETAHSYYSGTDLGSYQFISLEHVINNFMIKTDQLRSDIGTLARDTYKLSEKSPHQMENWKWESKEEDMLVRNFMEKWLNGRETFEEPTNVMSDLDLRQRTMDIVSYVIKPKLFMAI